MFRVLCRELAVSLTALAAIAIATIALAARFGAPRYPDGPALLAEVPRGPAHWTELLAAIGAALRLACFAVLVILAILIVVRIVVAGLLLLRLDYAILAHLAVALRLPVVRRAGATAVVGLLLAPASTIAAGVQTTTRRLPVSPIHVTTLRRAHETNADASAPRMRRRVRTRRLRMVLKSAGLALRYTVQPGDTLSFIAERLCGDAQQDRAIFRASRFLRQSDGQYLTNPNVIYPGWTLLIPLRVVTALRVAGTHVIYVVRPGDSLSAIAARFLGDWRRYTELQPEGTTITNDNLIYPGLVLRLPIGAMVSTYALPAYPRRLRPRCRTGRSVPRHPAVTVPHLCDPAVAPRELRDKDDRSRTPVRRKIVPIRQKHGMAMGRHVQRRGRPHSSIRPKHHIHPRRRQRRPSFVVPTTPTAVSVYLTPPPVDTAIASPVAPTRYGPTRTPKRPTPHLAPSVRLPDVGRAWPLPLLLALAPLFMLVARKRRRVTAIARAFPASAGTRLVPSMRRAIVAARVGVRGHLARAVDAGTSRGDVNVVAHVIAALEDAGYGAGLPVSLASAISTIMETADHVRLDLDGRQLSDDALCAVEQALNEALQTSVQSERVVDGSGTPRVRLILPRSSVASVRQDRDVDAHPVPLLVPLGEMADGTVVHVNLGRVSPILVAGGARGANTLAATMLASVLAQASPARLRLLVSSNDDELRGMLPALEHLEAPPADASDVMAAAAIVAQAHRLIMERFTDGEEGPAGPDYLIVLDTIEELRAASQTLDLLDAVCRNGRICGVHIVATTSDVEALSAAGMVEPFRALLARPLTAEESRVLFDDDGARDIDANESLLRMNTTGDVVRLSPFTLTLPEVREVFAQVALASTPDAVEAAEGSLPPVDPTSRPDSDPCYPCSAETGPQSPLLDNQGNKDPNIPRGDAVSIAIAADTIDAAAASASSPTSTKADDLPEASREVSDTAQAAPTGQNTLTQPEQGIVPPPIELRVLGGITVLAHGTPVVLQPREQRLLAALAVMGPAAVRPDRLVEALFADDDPLSGQDKLQHSITDIRLILKKAGVPVGRAGVVRYTDAGYILDPSLVDVDAHRFRDLLRRSETVENTQRFVLLAEAIEIYAGNLCGDQMSDWVEGYRYTWRKEYLAALYELALHYEQVEKDKLGALRVARRLVSEEPLQDHYHQMVLELIAATGDLIALDTHYEELHAAYARDGVAMDSYTEALYERLRAELTRERRSPDGSTKAG